MNKNTQRGAMGMVLVVVAAVGLAVWGIYIFIDQSDGTSDNTNIDNTTSDKATNLVNETVDRLDIPSTSPTSLTLIFAEAPSLTLDDINDGQATGQAWLARYNGMTYHRVRATNMPALVGDDFYEGWLVIPGGSDVRSTGVLDYAEATGTATLDYAIAEDLTDHTYVVITVEPNDGNPAPAGHIIEATYPDGTDFAVTI
jgi:hypothetical protein